MFVDLNNAVTVNKRVATTPFPDDAVSVKTTVVKDDTVIAEKKVGVGRIANQSNIVLLTVVMSAIDIDNVEQVGARYETGMKVAVRSNSYVNQWAKDKYTAQDEEETTTFILVPESEILFIVLPDDEEEFGKN